MRKKLLATVLAASMVLSLAPLFPANTGTVVCAEEVNEAPSCQHGLPQIPCALPELPQLEQ